MPVLGLNSPRLIPLTTGQSLFVAADSNSQGYVERFTSSAQTTRSSGGTTIHPGAQKTLSADGVGDFLLLVCTRGELEWSVRVNGNESTTGLVDSSGQPVSTGAKPFIAGGVSKWKAAKARGYSPRPGYFSQARFGFLADSNGTGEGSGAGPRGLTGAAATGMARVFSNLAGFRTDSFFGDQNVSTSGTPVALGTYDPRIALGSGWAPDGAPSTYGGRFLIAPAGSTGKLTFTPATPFDSFRVWYPTTPGLNPAVGIYVDGVLIDTFSQITPGQQTMDGRWYPVARGTHTISFGVGGTAGNDGSGFIISLETFDSRSNAPVMLQGGNCGADIATLSGASSPWSPLNAAVKLSLDFAAVYCTINDGSEGTSASAYYASMEALVAALAPTTDGCLCVGYPSATGTAATNGTLDAYAAALRSIAQDYGWSFYDGRNVFGSSNSRATSKGYRFNDDHPNNAGHAAFAAGLYSFLTSIGV